MVAQNVNLRVRRVFPCRFGSTAAGQALPYDPIRDFLVGSHAANVSMARSVMRCDGLKVASHTLRINGMRLVGQTCADGAGAEVENPVRSRSVRSAMREWGPFQTPR